MRPSAQFRRRDAGRRKRVNCEIGGLFGLGTAGKATGTLVATPWDGTVLLPLQ